MSRDVYLHTYPSSANTCSTGGAHWCMRVCVCVCTYICLHAYMTINHVHRWQRRRSLTLHKVRMYASMHTHRIYKHIHHMYTHIYRYVYVYWYVSCMHQCIHIISAHISIHMYTSIHMYIHTYIARCACLYGYLSTCTHYAVYKYIHAGSPWCGPGGLGFKGSSLSFENGARYHQDMTIWRYDFYVGAVTISFISRG